MKTKFLKIGLPIMVFMMAIVFAFASTLTTKTEDTLALVPGYIMQNGECKQVTVCGDLGPLCIYNGIVVRTKISETQCGINLYHWAN